MLGRTAGSLFWMFRYLERCENTARLIEAGFQIALTRTDNETNIWQSIIATAGVINEYTATHDEYSQENVVDFLLRDTNNVSSVISMMRMARDNARAARTALTREVWEGTNQSWLIFKDELKRPIKSRDLPIRLEMIRRQTSLVRGALYGTMLRNDIYDFAHLGCYVERIESTARILDVKYYVLLPSVSQVGSSIDNVHWETILRSVSAHQSYRWLNQNQIDPASIANFLILDRRLPRSIAYCVGKVYDHLCHLSKSYQIDASSLNAIKSLHGYFETANIDDIFSEGLHEFLQDIIEKNAKISSQIEQNYRFYS